MTIEEFYTDLMQEIKANGSAYQNYTASAFIEHMCTLLENEGVISEFETTDFIVKHKNKPLAVDAWSYDRDRLCLSLVLGNLNLGEEIGVLTKTNITSEFKKLKNFIEFCLDESFVEALEESTPAASLAWFINKNRASGAIAKIQLILASNNLLSTRVGELPSDSIGTLETTYDVWDLGRIYRFEMSGKSREDMEIEFEDTGIPCLPANTNSDEINSYLLVMPGDVLAELYDKYGERLLEQNVRTFLQFRGKINKGIRNTIVNEPDMFFSYNNGLSATAELVETNKDSSRITKIKNLQIVNGGQTTASIFTAKRKERASLENIYVQVKLSVINPEKAEDIVPRISEYANTQNKVNAADFFSNHPFHLRIEEFSRRVWAPTKTGSVNMTHWFYERTRGQYVNQQAKLGTGDARVFISQNPKSQMLTKTDLAKYILSFDEFPHEVSTGAQKAFSGTQKNPGFVKRVAEKWDSDNSVFNELWFKHAIAKAIFFRDVDYMVKNADWYGGYKANIVTYTLAKFANMAKKAKACIDFMKIWNYQHVPDDLMQQLHLIALAVNEHLIEFKDKETSNISEYAKMEVCWDRIKKLEIPLTRATTKYFTGVEEVKEAKREAQNNQIIRDGISKQTYVVEKGAQHWTLLLEWNDKNRRLSPAEMQLVELACRIPRVIPTEIQSSRLIQAEQRAIENGFFVR